MHIPAVQGVRGVWQRPLVRVLEHGSAVLLVEIRQ